MQGDAQMMVRLRGVRVQRDRLAQQRDAVGHPVLLQPQQPEVAQRVPMVWLHRQHLLVQRLGLVQPVLAMQRHGLIVGGLRG